MRGQTANPPRPTWRSDAATLEFAGQDLIGAVGKAVDTVKKGDKVVLPFNIGCGFCANCERGLSGYCLTCADPSVMPGMAGAAYGFAGMGPYAGGQAEYFFNPQWAAHTLMEYERLTGSSAESPLVTQRGSPNQFTFGVGATYSFNIRQFW